MLEFEMLNIFWNFVVLLLVMFVIVGLAIACFDFWKWQKEYRRQRVNRKMLAELKKFGPLFVVNKKGGVTAVCTMQAFSNALSDWKKKVLENPKGEWGNSMIYVTSTFTFSNDIPFCTGSLDDAEDIAVDLIYYLLGEKYDRLTIRGVKNLGKIIAKEDSRLYVPFVGDRWIPTWEDYRHTDMEIAGRMLLDKVLEAALSTKAK